MIKNNKMYIEEIIADTDSLSKYSDMLNGSVIMVTGATGMIGKRLVDTLLTMGICNVIAVGRSIERLKDCFGSNDNLLLLKSDYLNIDYSKEVDYIIHTASETQSKNFIEKPVETIMSTVGMANAVLQFASEKRVSKCIILSTQEVYGMPNASQHEFMEDELGYLSTVNVRNSYPEAKRLTEILATSYAAEYSLKMNILRVAKTYASVDKINDNRIFAQFTRSVLAKENIVLATSGQMITSFCYVSDVISGIIACMRDGVSGEIYNVANDSASIYSLASIFAEIGDVDVVISASDNDITGYSNVSSMLQNCDKLRSIGWTGKVDLKSGITRKVNTAKYVAVETI